MRYLPPDDSNVKQIDRSVDLTKALRSKSADFATRAAQVEFGRAYVPLSHSDFRDRTPDEVRAAQAAGWPGAAR